MSNTSPLRVRKRIWPEVAFTARSTQRPNVVLPQPLSPTSPSTSPALSSKLTSSTALTWPTTRRKKPFSMGKYFFSDLTWRMLSMCDCLLSGLNHLRVEEAGGLMPSVHFDQRRVNAVAQAVDGDRAAWIKAAAHRL